MSLGETFASSKGQGLNWKLSKFESRKTEGRNEGDDMSNTSMNPMNNLILKAQRLSNCFNELLVKSDHLLDDGKNVQRKLVESCGVQDDQLLKNLIKYCKDDECIHHMLENAELKQTVDDYKTGVKEIMGKYKQHCEGDALTNHYDLRAKYVAGLQQVVNQLDKRIEEMTLLMIFTVTLEDQHCNENKRIIGQLQQENEQMRRQLQISQDAQAGDHFQQGRPPQNESSTQIEYGDTYPDDSDTDSTNSIRSFITCASYANSAMSELEKPQGSSDT